MTAHPIELVTNYQTGDVTHATGNVTRWDAVVTRRNAVDSIPVANEVRGLFYKETKQIIAVRVNQKSEK
jgi:hypothetical protein